MRLKVKFLLLVLVLFFSQQGGANTSTSSLNASHQHTKKNPFTLEFVLASEQTKDFSDHSINGTYNKIDMSLLYSMDSNNEFRYFLSSIYQINSGNNRDEQDQFTWDLTELMYRRKDILTEQKNGIELTAELKNYYLLDSDKRELYGFDGAFIPQLIFEKRIGRKGSLEFKIRHHFYHTNNDKVSTLQDEDRLYLTSSYMLGHSWILYNQFTYKHKKRKDSYFSRRSFSMIAKHNEEFIVHPGVMYFLSRTTLIEAYVETRLNKTDDDRSLSTMMSDELVVGAALYLKAF
jgi:hypothetical protein